MDCLFRLGNRGGGQRSVIFKHAVKKKRWNIERAFRGLFTRGSSLIRRIESARKNGFNIPMRIFLFAEKYNYGIVQERFLIAEHIDGIDLRPIWREHKEKVWETVLSMHKYRLGWGGDPNMGNFLLTKDGTLRAIDPGFNRPSWIARGKDLYCLEWLYNISDGKFRFKVLAAKIQNKIKSTGPYGENGEKALKQRLKEDEALKKRHPLE